MVNIWKYKNYRIEDILKEFKVAKETLKVLNKELVDYIIVMLGPLAIVRLDNSSPSTFNPSEEENKNLLIKLKQER